MNDSFGRDIIYMRISITDRCNLRCVYCMPFGIELSPRDEVLRIEEFEMISLSAAMVGIRHIRVTGGEPLVRKGCDRLIAELKRIPGIETVTITTNGILLNQCLSELKSAGIDGINISLDTTYPNVYSYLTGGGDVRAVIDAAINSCVSGIRTKINAISMREEGMYGVDAKSLEEVKLLPKGNAEAVLSIAKDYPIDVRFIEMMPIGYGKKFRTISNREVFQRISEMHPLIERDESKHGSGPAVYYKIPGYRGSVGFISAISGKFCSACNRIRLTSGGFLKTCLSYNDGIDLRSIVRDETLTDDRKVEKLQAVITDAVLRKKASHCFEYPDCVTEGNLMASIGG